eukprot:TRINITY_DN26129_c0_g1_i1.p1 TRINITY_DN26129_c0_g1~~TRINITY_DN26129_c0_g1_i1.p1  ORF type:complete len:553 (-),score=119.97 TRINITY_DN26129_c0_g1_i1:97-1755(-)
MAKQATLFSLKGWSPDKIPNEPICGDAPADKADVDVRRPVATPARAAKADAATTGSTRRRLVTKQAAPERSSALPSSSESAASRQSADIEPTVSESGEDTRAFPGNTKPEGGDDVQPEQPEKKKHRGERWGDSWMEGYAPSAEEAAEAFLPTRTGTGRCKRTEENKRKMTRGAVAKAIDGELPPETSKASLKASEKAAQAAVEEEDFSLAKILEVLKLLQVPPNFTRKNVMPEGQEYVQGLLLGMYAYAANVGVSQKTHQHPWLTKLLIGALRAVAPDFPFTSIQLNYNYASRPHIDKNNLGTSFIVGLGDYTDGELWVHDDTGDTEFTLEGQDVNGYYHVGRPLKGQLLQIRDAWTIFDGNLLHYTKPFTGERYSIIFFTSDRYAATSEEEQEKMAKAGFDFDFKAADLEAVLKDKHQRRADIAKKVAAERAEEERRRLLMRGRCVGRVWAAGWGLRCTACREPGSDFCGSHMQKDRWKTHGRVDGDLPPAKRDEMAWYQKKFVAAGKRPPVREGATILVPIPGWPETDHLAEAMKAYGEFRGKARKNTSA